MNAERGSSKHGTRLDEKIKQETEGLVRGGGTSHAEEWKESEPVQDPEADLRDRGYAPGHEPGVASGMTQQDVEQRGALAIWLAGARFPADRESLLAHVKDDPAVPDAIIQALRGLPDGTYSNLGETAQALGLGLEQRFGD